MADLLKSFHNPDAKIGSSVFDLSCKRVFSGKAGQCLPAFVNDTVPGDKFEIDMAALCRTNTLETPAFIRGKFNYDFFFVPYTQLWHRFNDFVSQKDDLHTSLYVGTHPVSTPTISLKQLVRLIINNICDDEYQTPYSLIDKGYDMLRLLDLLGYGNYYPIAKACASQGADSQLLEQYLSNYFHNDAMPAQSPHALQENGDYFINPFRLAAYQHIWYDFYRNKYFDLERYTSGYDDNYQDFFNLDNVNCSTDVQARMVVPAASPESADAVRFYGMCTLRYCQWKKDIYTALMPSQQFGVVSSVDFLSNSIVTAVGSAVSGKRVLSNNAGKLVASSEVTDGSAPSSYYNNAAFISNSFDVLSLRRAEALQKWKEAALRAGNMNDRNQKAHFGVEPYYYEDNNVHFLGSFDGTLQLNPVAATADASSGNNNKVGDLAASATAVANGSKINFECRDYGIIMCIARFVPESEYSSSGIEMPNTRFEPFDYYNPEFANLGLQSVPLYIQDLNGRIMANKNMSLGYAPRDYDYKQNVDKVYGEFDTLFRDSTSDIYKGVFSNWVSPRQEFLVNGWQNTASGRAKKSFYVDPGVLDSVFGKVADEFQDTDQFVFNAYFDVKAIRKMPVLGLPEF